jgi:outer membrane protein
MTEQRSVTDTIDNSKARPATRSTWRGRGSSVGVAARLAVILASVPLFAISGAQAETLQEVWASAYRYNPRLDAARAALRATDEEVARANSGYRPTINATADQGFQQQSSQATNGTRASSETHPAGYGAQAVQPIFRGFRTLNTVREAEATVRAGRENLRLVEQAVLLDATTAYMDTIRDAAIVKIRENNVDVLSRELRATKERFAVGEVTRTDVAQAEARRAGTVSALDLARANLKTSRGNFERHVGRPPNNLVEPKPAGKRLPRSLEEAIAVSSRENPTVISALYREQGARHTIDRIWGELLPTLTLEANYSRRFEPSSLIDQTESSSVIGRLTVPLYTSGEVQARVRQAKHTHISRIQEIEQNRADIQSQVVAFWSQLSAARAQLESDNAQVSALATALAGVREEEKVGQRTLLDILNAEQELLNAQVNQAATKRNIVVASYSVLSSIGRLNIQELDAASEVYDPSLHYFEVRRKWWGVSITHADGKREALDLWQTVGKPYHEGRGEPVAPPPAKHAAKPTK